MYGWKKCLIPVCLVACLLAGCGLLREEETQPSKIVDSMASPNLAGISALVKEYATSAEGLGYADGEQVNALVRALLMSTATPLVYQNQDGLYYSPRNQGSGLANAYDAITTQAYLSVNGCDVPKVELYDDPGKVGAYNYSFQVHNFGEENLYYDLNTVAQTEGVNEAYAQLGYLFMSSTPKALGAATAETSSAMVYTHDVNGSGTCDSHDAYWIFQAVSGQPEDENWTDLDFRYNTTGDETVTTGDVQAYLNALVGLESEADLEAQVLEVKAGETQTVNVSVSLSPNEDGCLDNINDMYVSLLRNASEMVFTYSNQETGEVYFQDGILHVNKSSYSAGNGICLPYVYSWYGMPYYLTDADGEYLANNTKLTLTISGKLDYPGAPEVEKSVDITVDTQAPELLAAEIIEQDGQTYLGLMFQDNVSVAAVILGNENLSQIYGMLPADDAEARVTEDGGLVWTQFYNVTGLGDSFGIALGDYAVNESNYRVTPEGAAPIE